MYKNLIRAAFLLATGIFMTACSSGDDNFADNTTPVTPDTQKNIVTLTGTINIGSSDITRAVDGSGHAYWTKGDEVLIAYEKSGDAFNYGTAVGTITNVTDNEADFTAKLENPKNEGRIGLAYPYGKVSVASTTNNFGFSFTFGDSYYNEQKGTPESITSLKLDYASSVTDGKMEVPSSGGRASIESSITLKNQVSLCKFSLKVRTSESPETYSPLSATQLKITLGGNSYTITPNYSTDVFYVAMQPQTTTLGLEVTYNSASTTTDVLDPNNLSDDDIKKIIAVKPNEDNKAYLVNKSSVSTATFTKNYASNAYTEGKFYKQDVKYITDKFIPVAVVAYVGQATNNAATPAATYCEKFIALALDDVPTAGVSTLAAAGANASTWAGQHGVKIDGDATNYNTISEAAYDAVEPCTTENSYNSNTRTASLVKGWRIPSITDWRYVFQGLNGGTNPSATNPVGVGDHEHIYSTTGVAHYYTPELTLYNLINTSCGNEKLKPQYYWTGSMLKQGSTTYDGQGGRDAKGWRYSFVHDYWMWNQTSDMALIRAVFAY